MGGSGDGRDSRAGGGGGGSGGPPSYKFHGALYALAANHDTSQVVVAGRNVLSVLSVVGNRMTEVTNLMAGKKPIGSLYYSNDVRWCRTPALRNILVTASTDGNILVWDLATPDRVSKTTLAHTRTINRLCLDRPEKRLLSASQDGLIKQWDLATMAEVATYKTSYNSGARDVQFHPTEPDKFASAYEQNTIEVWDMRASATRAARKFINAHQDPVYTIDFSADGTYLASGSRDRTVKIWDSRFDKYDVVTFQTISSVIQVQWRPGRSGQVVSAANQMDKTLQVWDVRRPYVPVYTLDGQDDSTAALLWKDSEVIWSCTKKENLFQQRMSSGTEPTPAYHLASLMPPSAVSWSPTGDLAFANLTVPGPLPTIPTADLVDGGVPRGRKPQPKKDELPNKRTAAEEAAWLTRKLQLCAVATTGIFDRRVFVALATGYRLSGASPPELCMHNAEAVDAVGGPADVAQSWRVLAALLAASDLMEDAGAGSTELARTGTRRRRSNAASADWTGSGAMLLDVFDDPFDSPDSATLTSTRSGGTAGGPSGDTVRAPSTATLVWQDTPALREMLQFYAGQGDVQTCVCMLVVLKGHLSMDDDDERRWYDEYVDLLQRFKLWDAAAAIVLASNNADVRSRSQISTTYPTRCGHCGKLMAAQESGYFACKACQKVVSQCALCHQTVRGLFIWCQGCGHGGHVGHMQAWFATSAQCPAACGHLCTVTAAQAAPRLATPASSAPPSPMTPIAAVGTSATRAPAA